MANLTHYDIIKKPVVSEKSMNQMADKKYTFIVHKDATKTQVKEAVEKLFEGAKVVKVNTSRYDGKVRRRGMVLGRTNSYKKATVTLSSDSKEIELFSSLSNK